MTKAKPRNRSASIRQRLLNHSTATKTDPNLVLIWYALERFLYRLSISAYSEYAKDPGHVRQWAAFAGRLGTEAAPGLDVVIEDVAKFVLPPAGAAAASQPFNQRWKPDDRWRAVLIRLS